MPASNRPRVHHLTLYGGPKSIIVKYNFEVIVSREHNSSDRLTTLERYISTGQSLEKVLFGPLGGCAMALGMVLVHALFLAAQLHKSNLERAEVCYFPASRCT